jgi:hypothetical protein
MKKVSEVVSMFEETKVGTPFGGRGVRRPRKLWKILGAFLISLETVESDLTVTL